MPISPGNRGQHQRHLAFQRGEPQSAVQIFVAAFFLRRVGAWSVEIMSIVRSRTAAIVALCGAVPRTARVDPDQAAAARIIIVSSIR